METLYNVVAICANYILNWNTVLIHPDYSLRWLITQDGETTAEGSSHIPYTKMELLGVVKTILNKEIAKEVRVGSDFNQSFRNFQYTSTDNNPPPGNLHALQLLRLTDLAELIVDCRRITQVDYSYMLDDKYPMETWGKDRERLLVGKGPYTTGGDVRPNDSQELAEKSVEPTPNDGNGFSATAAEDDEPDSSSVIRVPAHVWTWLDGGSNASRIALTETKVVMSQDPYERCATGVTRTVVFKPATRPRSWAAPTGDTINLDTDKLDAVVDFVERLSQEKFPSLTEVFSPIDGVRHAGIEMVLRTIEPRVNYRLWAGRNPLNHLLINHGAMGQNRLWDYRDNTPTALTKDGWVLMTEGYYRSRCPKSHWRVPVQLELTLQEVLAKISLAKNGG